MARCYQCGSETDFQSDGTPICISCSGKASLASQAPTTAELNARLNGARDEYKRAVAAQRQALEFKRTLEPNNADGSMALQNANYQVELASVRFRKALRDFVTALGRN